MYEPASGNEFGAVFFVVILAIYLYFSYAQYKIAQRLGHSDPWWAFVPFINTYQLVQMAQKEWYWFLFLFIPIVNIVCFAILWMDVARSCGKAPFWGIMMLLPFLNFVSIGVLAFGAPDNTFPAPEEPRPRQPEHVA